MGYRMKGFSGFGNSPAKQQSALEKKIVSEEVDVAKDENKLDGDKTSSKDDIIKSPDKEKTSPIMKKLPVDKSKDFDLDYTTDVTVGNKKLIKKMENKYKAGKITKKEFNEAKKEISSYEDI